MKKVERDGKVAVVYSPIYGQGWSTLSRTYAEAEILAMDARITGPVLEGDVSKPVEVVRALFPDRFQYDKVYLTISWVKKGTSFVISECDGKEQIRLLRELDIFEA